jgi:hypothetical protein
LLGWLVARTPDQGEVRYSSDRAPIFRCSLAGGPGVKALAIPPASRRRSFIVVVGFLDFDFFVLFLDLFFFFDRGLDRRGFRS